MLEYFTKETYLVAFGGGGTLQKYETCDSLEQNLH